MSYSARPGSANNSIVLRLDFNPQPAFVQTPFGVVGGPRTVQTPFGPVAVQTPDLATIEPISRIDPIYPALAQQARIQGAVVMEVGINAGGKVQNIKVRTGHPLLIQAAIDAVKQWVYPAQTGDVTTLATINFSF